MNALLAMISARATASACERSASGPVPSSPHAASVAAAARERILRLFTFMSLFPSLDGVPGGTTAGRGVQEPDHRPVRALRGPRAGARRHGIPRSARLRRDLRELAWTLQARSAHGPSGMAEGAERPLRGTGAREAVLFQVRVARQPLVQEAPEAHGLGEREPPRRER